MTEETDDVDMAEDIPGALAIPARFAAVVGV
jgi:hypothetical protein